MADNISYAIGIDVGTTNTKCALYALPEGRLVELESRPTPRACVDGVEEFSVDGILQAIEGAVQRLAGLVDGRVAFIAIASIGESGVLVSKDGQWAEGSMLWFDPRCADYMEDAWDDGTAQALYHVTGVPAHGNYALPKILWLRDHGAELEGATWLPMADFIAWWLTGTRAMDASLASRTLVLDVPLRQVSDLIVESYALPRELFPPVLESGEARGLLDEAAAAGLGILPGCTVHVAGHDHMAGSVAAGFDPSCELLNSTGTTEGLLVVNDVPDTGEEMCSAKVSNGCYVQPGLWSLYASIPTAGYCFEWAAGVVGRDPDALFERQPVILERYLAGDMKGRETLFVPHLRGSGPPRRSSAAKGAIWGLTDATDADDIQFGIMLGLCFELKSLYLTMYRGKGRPIMRVIGPATKSPLWMQLKADVLGIDTVAADATEAVATGAVELVARKLGLMGSVDASGVRYEADMSRFMYLNALYEERFLPFERALLDMEGIAK